MKLNGSTLRARRLELGLTTRELARVAQVSQTLITRLEKTGDPSTLSCQTVQHILDALGASISEVVREAQAGSRAKRDTIADLGAVLIERSRVISSAQLAQLLDTDQATVDDALRELAALVHAAGIRVQRLTGGVRFVSAVRTGHHEMKATLHLARLTNADIGLLYRCYHRRVTARNIAATNNGNVSLHRLLGAGLLEFNQAALQLGPTARDAFQDPTDAEPSDPQHGRPEARPPASHERARLGGSPNSGMSNGS